MFIFINSYTDNTIIPIVNQIRLFYNGDIYIIAPLSDKKDYFNKLKYIYNVYIIDHEHVKNLQILMFKLDLYDCFVINNAIVYDNPIKLINNFSNKITIDKSLLFLNSYSDNLYYYNNNDTIIENINSIVLKTENLLKIPFYNPDINSKINILPIYNNNYILSAPLYEFIITGEKIQKLCHIYIGNSLDDFKFNPNLKDNNKYVLTKSVNSVENLFDNPKIVYSYSNNLKYIDFNNFKNDFILISGNSDENIIDDKLTEDIVNNPKLILWYSQNVCVKHPKIHFLPIGIANSQWAHGNIKLINDLIENDIQKTEFIYFNFDINTNKTKRRICYDTLKFNIPFLDTIDANLNIIRLSKYKFCICPEGNGVDTHRLWECWYFKIVPIVIKSDFIDVLMEKINLPIIILDKWDNLFNTNINLDYNSYIDKFVYCKYLDFNYYRNSLLNCMEI